MRSKFFWNDEVELDYESMSLGELMDVLDDLYNTLPKDKRSKEYKKQKDLFNKVAKIYNLKFRKINKYKGNIYIML